MNINEARERHSFVRTKIEERLDAMAALTAGDSMSRNQAEAFDRHERNHDQLVAELKSIEAAHPELKPLSADEVRSLVMPPMAPIDIGAGVGAHTTAEAMRNAHGGTHGTLSAFVEERHGRTFEGADASQFNLGRAVQGLVTGRWDDSPMEQRALSNADASGGYAVPDILSGQIIDRINSRTVAIDAGVSVVPMESSTVFFPRITSGVTGTWKAENAPLTEEGPSFDRVTLEAKTLTCLVKLSQELFEDLTDAGSKAIEREISTALAVELDRAVFSGSGSNNQPLGIRNQSGISTTANGSNGASPAYSQLVSAVSTLKQANVTPNAIVMHPRTSALLAGLSDSTGQPLRAPGYLDGIRQLDSTVIPANLSTGTSSNTSVAITGDFSQCLLGVRPQFGVRIIRDSSAFAANLQIGIIAYMRVDVQLAQPAAFNVQTGLKSA